MEADALARAVDATISTASSLGLPVEEAAVLQNSNKVALRLMPCDAVARVSTADHPHATFEIGIAKELEVSGSPVAGLYPGVAARAHEASGFEISFWTFHQALPNHLSSEAYAEGLARLHAGMRGVGVGVGTPHFTDRVGHAERLVATRHLSPSLAEPDRKMLLETLRRIHREIAERSPEEQLLHGEPHPGNVLHTKAGALFIDLETCCVGPVEFDLAHAPAAVAALSANIDGTLLSDCRELVLAMVAAWRFEREDQLPNGPAFGRQLLDALRTGPPWPTVGEVIAELGHEW